MKSIVAALAILFSLTIQAKAQDQCPSRAWINAFHPEQPVFPKPTDKCPADENKSLYTREGTLACSTQEGFQAAFNAMEHGWTYVPTAGVAVKDGEKTGMTVSPEYYGCTIHHDGIPVQIFSKTFSSAQTNLGWLSRDNLRNDPMAGTTKTNNDSLRPTLCDKHGTHCVFTDVHPYQPVDSNR